MANSQNPQIKCFSTIITRFILCKGSRPTHPSDNITETKLGQNVDLEKDQNSTESKTDHISSPTTKTTAPGLVARLMGLDAIPDLKWVPKSDSFPRSKSVNSMDYLINFNSPSSNQQQHRRVRTSVSFREGSTGLCTQNHEYFIFFLDTVDENNELRSNVEKTEVGFEELKQRKTGELKKNREKIVVVKKNKEKKSFKGNDEARRVCTKPHTVSNRRTMLAPVNQIVIPAAAAAEVKFTKKKKRSNQMVKQTERKTEQERTLSVDSRPTISKSRRKSLQNRTNLEYRSPNDKRVPNDYVLKDEVIKKAEKKTSNANNEETDYTKMLSDIRKLTEEENKKEPNWVASNEDLEEISVEFEHQILDQMLYQMVHELNEYSML